MKTKRLLCPERLRLVPHRFSWIDQRLVRDGHCARCGPNALALYFLLVTVADAQGFCSCQTPTAFNTHLAPPATLQNEQRSAEMYPGIVPTPRYRRQDAILKQIVDEYAHVIMMKRQQGRA